eukprot:12429041-Alexandrium_andersonii.AAC.1
MRPRRVWRRSACFRCSGLHGSAGGSLVSAPIRRETPRFERIMPVCMLRDRRRRCQSGGSG